MIKNLVAKNETTVVNAITHGGIFHADEVFATVILMKYFNGDFCVMRTNEVPKDLKVKTVIYDIGHGKYDHHQFGGNGTRENGVPYASAGLIWKDFGMDVIPDTCSDKEMIWKIIDSELIQGIDAVDNGVMPKPSYPCQALTVSQIISGFNPSWDEDTSTDVGFEKAVEFAEQIFDNVMKSALGKLAGKCFVERAIEASEETTDDERWQGRRIMVLQRFVPWQDWLLTSKSRKADTILYVVYPAIRGGYNCQCVPATLGSFDTRKALPEFWRGLQNDKLQEVTGVATAIFCHPAGFICGAETLEDAIMLAKIAATTEKMMA